MSAERVVAGAGRADRGVEERERQPDREAGHREPGQDPRERQVTAARRVGEMSTFRQHGAMVARRGSAPKGAHPRIGREVSLSPARSATTRRPSLGSDRR